MRLVLDTNVLVSAVISYGPPYEIVRAWRNGVVEIAVSQQVFDEYERVLTDLAFRRPGRGVDRVLKSLRDISSWVTPEQFARRICTHAADDKFLAAAVAGNCELIISGDKHLLRVSGFQGVCVLTARQFVDRYLTGPGQCSADTPGK